MRRTLTLAVFACLTAASTGCGLCGGAKPGFSIGYHLPPTVNQAALIGPQVTQYSAQGLAVGPTAGQLGLYSADAPPMAPPQLIQRAPCASAGAYAPAAPRAPLQPELTPDDIYRMLELIYRRLDQLPAAQPQRKERAPMPKCNGEV